MVRLNVPVKVPTCLHCDLVVSEHVRKEPMPDLPTALLHGHLFEGTPFRCSRGESIYGVSERDRKML